VWLVTFKGLLAHRVRLVLTTLSVVLGVAFVAGAFVFSDTMSAVFDDLVRGGSEATDVLVRAEVPEGMNVLENMDVAPPLLPESLLDEVLAVDGVADAEGGVEGFAMIVRPDGEAIIPMGPPTLGAGWSPTGGRTIVDGGRPPSGPDEVVVDRRTAARNDLQPGDRVEIVFSTTAPRPFTIVGLSTKEGGDNLAGASLAEFELPVAQQVLDLAGHFTGISVRAQDGVEPEALVERLEMSLPGDVEAITAAAFADETLAGIDEALGFFRSIFLVFAGVAVFVGIFIIVNTFSITVLQRTREFALLRSLGASRRQIVGSVIGEAVLVGIVASVIGIAAGLGLATGLSAMLSLFGVDMPSGALVLELRTVLVSLALGVVVTVVASVLPARRAAATHPMAALRAVEIQAYRTPRGRLVSGIVAALTAVPLIAYPAIAQPDGSAALVVLGALLALVALFLLGPSLTGPVLRLFGGSGARFGIVGRLARSNSLRRPRRTWVSAGALMIGVTIVGGFAVVAGSMKASADSALEGAISADVILSASNAMTGGTVPPLLAEELATAPEVGAISPIRAGSGQVDGASATLVGVHPASWNALATTVFEQGTVEDLAAPGTVAVDAERARERGYAIGDMLPAVFPDSGSTELRVGAVFEPDQLLAEGWLVSLETYQKHFARSTDAQVLLAGAEGIEPEVVLAAVERVAAAYPAVLVQDQTQFRESAAGQVDQLLGLVTALLGMALLIAILGIMNTLALSVHERTHEIGLLRAVGMTRRQVRGMVRWEAVTVALLGASVGLLLGVVLGWAFARALAEQGLTTVALPFGQLAGAVVLAALAGVLAAVLPARGAAKLDVLRAVTVE
jgi:putative ABC transport system permease protein